MSLGVWSRRTGTNLPKILQCLDMNFVSNRALTPVHKIKIFFWTFVYMRRWLISLIQSVSITVCGTGKPKSRGVLLLKTSVQKCFYRYCERTKTVIEIMLLLENGADVVLQWYNRGLMDSFVAWRWSCCHFSRCYLSSSGWSLLET